jgi:phosphoglycerol transferase
VFWGFEDEKLFAFAKERLSALASAGKPFNLTMLTVDTHHVGGYVCEECTPSSSRTKCATVVSCADRQLAEFIAWCQEQDFYENTAIVITGDHPRMDTQLVKEVDYYDRTMYNCFINAAVEPQGATAGRTATSFDLFPTTLAALGFAIPGDRLGLGVNLFSDEATLAEQLGYDHLEAEISKFSDYYIRKFS